MKRLFLAIPIPKEEVNRLAAYADSYKKDTHFHDAKWVEPKNLHITALFMGDVQDAAIPEMIQLLRGILAKIPPFELHLESIILQPIQKPKMLWARFHRSFEFNELAAEIKKYLFPYLPDLEENAEGHNSKKPIPHLTLARLKTPLDSGKYFLKPYKMPPLSVTECRLYESTLIEGGPIYTLIETFPYAVS